MPRSRASGDGLGGLASVADAAEASCSAEIGGTGVKGACAVQVSDSSSALTSAVSSASGGAVSASGDGVGAVDGLLRTQVGPVPGCSVSEEERGWSGSVTRPW